MEITITKDTEKALCEIYAAYLNRRADGFSRNSAKSFPDKAAWPKEYLTEWSNPDFRDCLSELKRAGLVKLFINGGFELLDPAIIYMEQRFQRDISKVLDWLAKVKSAVPFL